MANAWRSNGHLLCDHGLGMVGQRLQARRRWHRKWHLHNSDGRRIGSVWIGRKMKMSTKTTMANFTANVHFILYKRGLTTAMIAEQFGLSVNQLDEILAGRERSDKAMAIIRDIIKFY